MRSSRSYALEEVPLPAGRKSSTPTRSGQFTSAAFTGALIVAGVRISMDGRNRRMDNVFIGRLWLSLKREYLYLKSYADGREPHAGARPSHTEVVPVI
jgi:putative transposase